MLAFVPHTKTDGKHANEYECGHVLLAMSCGPVVRGAKQKLFGADRMCCCGVEFLVHVELAKYAGLLQCHG